MIVSRRSVLCIMFVVLMLADIGVGKAMISAYSREYVSLHEIETQRNKTERKKL